MDTPEDDLQAIRQILAELTTRVYRIERRLQMDVQAAPQPQAPSVASASPLAVPPPSNAANSAPAPQIPPRSSIAVPPPPEIDLESRIGSHWLNRIGIAALLIGISYFLKFAFDNNWIGPAGRVAIGLVSGIAIIVWSERFRRKGHAAFSYSLKAVGI